MFDSPFFKQFPQSPSSFIDDEGNEKKYDFPTFYASCRATMAIFTCSSEKAKALMPTCRLMPVPAGLGRSLVVVAAFEYLNVKSVDPYNEILFAIPAIHMRAGLKMPRLGLSVQQLIVDQEENIQRGKHIWGMNKSMGEFKFFDEGDLRVCEVTRNGRRAVRLEVPKTGRTSKFEECRTLITEKDGMLLSAKSCVQGRRTNNASGAGIVFGADPFSAELQGLDISETPIKAQYVCPYNSAVSLPLESEPID